MTTSARPLPRGRVARAGGPPPRNSIVPDARSARTDPSPPGPDARSDAEPSRTGAQHDESPDPLRLWLRLLSCTNLIEQRVRSRLRHRFDTTLPRFDLLAQLDGAEREGAAGLTMTRLSRRMMVTNANVTALVARLEREGLVRRTASPGDRRSQTVALTSAGRRTLAAMTPDHARWIAAMFGGLAPDEREVLHRLVGTLKASVERAPLEETS